ncbi:MAG: DNA-binding HxlR family transcriptional regulator [Saprospiraceae bacterium]|jgi:DNA-binding HxlR family transcriptional regulator
MVTIADNQDDILRKKTKDFFKKSQDFVEKTGACPIRSVLSMATDKWSMLVIFNLAYHKTMRFNRFKHFIPDISSRMLSVTLKKLEKAHIVTREVFAEVPPRVEYQLTDFGKGLSERMIEMSDWMTENY